jgi:hypothetical protein
MQSGNLRRWPRDPRLGARFDDDGEIDVFLFGAKAHQYGSMNIENFRTLVPDVLARYELELGTYYGKAMRLIREFYFGSAQPRSAPLRSDQPVYVMFVTDGAPMDESDTYEQVMSSAFEPLFWEFMAIGRVTGRRRGRWAPATARQVQAAVGEPRVRAPPDPRRHGRPLRRQRRLLHGRRPPRSRRRPLRPADGRVPGLGGLLPGLGLV